MRLNILREFLNSRMHVAELWIFENSLCFYTEETGFPFHGNTRPFFLIGRGNGGERMNGWLVV